MKRFVGPWWLWSRPPPLPHHHHHRALSSPSTAPPPPPASAGATAPVGRKRHRFFNADDDTKDAVPTFREFQLRFQLRSLYRKYWRLARRNDELQRQIRTEFHRGVDQKKKDNNNDQTTMLLDERSISEGNRRYKELQSVLQTAAAPIASTISSQTNVDWPWNKARHTKPEVFPPKST
jgi:hypothetical protein